MLDVNKYRDDPRFIDMGWLWKGLDKEADNPDNVIMAHDLAKSVCSVLWPGSYIEEEDSDYADFEKELLKDSAIACDEDAHQAKTKARGSAKREATRARDRASKEMLVCSVFCEIEKMGYSIVKIQERNPFFERAILSTRKDNESLTRVFGQVLRFFPHVVFDFYKKRGVSLKRNKTPGMS